MFPHFDALWHAHCRHPCILFFSDTFVRVLYYVQRKVVERKKTKVVKKSTSPVFNEAFVFDMKDEELKHSSIMCEVYRGDTVKKTNRIGYITLGLERTIVFSVKPKGLSVQKAIITVSRD